MENTNVENVSKLTPTTKTIIVVTVVIIGIYIGYKLVQKFSIDPTADDMNPNPIKRRRMELSEIGDIPEGTGTGYGVGTGTGTGYGVGTGTGYGVGTGTGTGYGTGTGSTIDHVFTKNGTRLRASSNTKSAIKKTYTKRTKLKVTGSKKESDGIWYSVTEGANSGWVREDVVELSAF